MYHAFRTMLHIVYNCDLHIDTCVYMLVVTWKTEEKQIKLPTIFRVPTCSKTSGESRKIDKSEDDDVKRCDVTSHIQSTLKRQIFPML